MQYSNITKRIANYLIHWISVAFEIDFNPSNPKSLLRSLFKFIDDLIDNGFSFDANRIKLFLFRVRYFTLSP